MYAKQLTMAATAALTLILSTAPMAQGTAAQGAMDQQAAEAEAIRARIYEAGGGDSQPLSAADDAEKEAQVDAATAADSRYHANRTEANRVARDQAEAEAAATIQRLNGPPSTPDMQR